MLQVSTTPITLYLRFQLDLATTVICYGKPLNHFVSGEITNTKLISFFCKPRPNKLN